MAIKSISIRIDEELLSRLRRVARLESRSLNGQIKVLIRQCVEAYEKELKESEDQMLFVE